MERTSLPTLMERPIADFEVPTSTRTDYNVFVYTQAVGKEDAEFYLDSISFEPKSYHIDLTAPLSGDVYTEGETINFSTNVLFDLADGAVAYKINGNTVANGSGAQNTATLTLPAGSYEVEAVGGSYSSNKIPFTVVPKRSATLQATRYSGGTMDVALGRHGWIVQCCQSGILPWWQ